MSLGETCFVVQPKEIWYKMEKLRKWLGKYSEFFLSQNPRPLFLQTLLKDLDLNYNILNYKKIFLPTNVLNGNSNGQKNLINFGFPGCKFRYTASNRFANIKITDKIILE